MNLEKPLQEVWKWKEKLNKDFKKLSLEEIANKVEKDTSEIVKKLCLQRFRPAEKIQVQK